MNLPELNELGDLSTFGIYSLRTEITVLQYATKCPYGLKQVPRLWHQGIDGFLKA